MNLLCVKYSPTSPIKLWFKIKLIATELLTPFELNCWMATYAQQHTKNPPKSVWWNVKDLFKFHHRKPSLSKITLTQAKDPIIVFFSHESLIDLIDNYYHKQAHTQRWGK